jgi:hypothetical protein
MNMKTPRVLTQSFGANASIADTILFQCEEGAEYEVVEVMERHIAAGDDAGAVALDVVKCDSAAAIAAGATVLASTFNLKAAADTIVRKTAGNGGLSSALATRTIKAGQSLHLDFQGVLSTLAGVNITVILRQLRAGVHR